MAQIAPLPYQHILKQFGQNLQRTRKEKGISQEKLAEIVGVNRTYLSLVEQGHRNPSMKFLYRVVKALKTSSGKLLSF